MLYKRYFYLAVHKEMLKKQFFGAKYKFFSKRSSFRSQTFLSFRTLFSVYSKLVGTETPCILQTLPRR